HPTLLRASSAASAMNRPSSWKQRRRSPLRAAFLSTTLRAGRLQISSACSARCRLRTLHHTRGRAGRRWPPRDLSRMTFAVTILGCGFSGGVPRPGSGWGHCDPSNPKNRRRRCSVVVDRAAPDGQKTRVLVDTGPDLREQLLDADVRHIDGVLYTH